MIYLISIYTFFPHSAICKITKMSVSTGRMRRKSANGMEQIPCTAPFHQVPEIFIVSSVNWIEAAKGFMRAWLLSSPHPSAYFAAQISLPDLPASEIFYPSEYPVSETDRPGTGHRSWPAQVHSAQIPYQWYGWPWVGYHISLRIILVYECTANVVYFDGVLIQTLFVLMTLQKMMCFV